jgi:hypothetical protein
VSYPVRHLSRYIDRATTEVVAFLGDPTNLPQWASGLSSGIRKEGGVWISDSPMGKVEIRFAAANDLGVLDHDVKLSSGESVHNAMRVIPNGRGSELLFSVFQRDGISDGDFERDCIMVVADLEKAKSLLEASRRAG